MFEATRRVRWVVRQVGWNDGEPDPRVLQVGFTALLLGIALLRWADGKAFPLISWPVIGLALSVGGVVVALARPRLGTSAPFQRVVAVLSIMVVAMFAAGPDLGTASPLVVLPTLWLALDLGWRGGLLAVVATVVCITIPGMIAHGTDPATIERLLVIPVVASVGAAAISAGVTAARRAQTRAEAREEELREALDLVERTTRYSEAIFDAVDVGLALLDRDGKPLLVNDAVTHMIRATYPDGYDGESWIYDATGSERLRPEEFPNKRACAGEEFDDLRVWVGPEARSRRAVSISARRVERADGTLLGAALSYADITDLMRAVQVKDEFVALVSHELRTPLTSIVGYAALLAEDEGLDVVQRRQVAAVTRNADRLQRLVDDLLGEVQLIGQPVTLHEETTDLARLARECVEHALPDADRAQVRLRTDLPAAVPLLGDPERLGQVLDNLVSNAIKYTPAGGEALVAVGVEGGDAVLRVRDTGIGVPVEEQPELFQPFFRSRAASERAIQGIGLGLAVTKAIVESHRGRIEVDSEPGRGSEFRVVLPLRVSEPLTP